MPDDEENKISKKINGFLMGMIVGGAIGSVVGIGLMPGKNKPSLFKRIFTKLTKRQK